MKKLMLKLALAQALLAASGAGAIAQTSGASGAENGVAYPKLPLDAEREKQAFHVFLKDIQHQIVTTAEAMPATKYEFTPTEGEFTGVRSFARQVRHLSATNHILAAAALGEPASADIDENGPDTVRTKAEILSYLNSSFEHLGKAIDAIGDPKAEVKASPISPLPTTKTTRLALIAEALIHAFNHYGQMVEYLRMNGIVPPSSRP
jgi:uncharacterized damage-inducible protein DinB